MGSFRRGGSTRYFILVSFSISTLLAVVLLILGRGTILAVVLWAVIMFSIGLLERFLRAKNRETGWLLSLAIFSFISSVPELSLRVSDFRYEPRVQYGVLRPNFYTYFIPDRKLFWKYSSENPGVNSLGFRGKEPTTPKPKRTTRVLYLGDSCTEQDFARFVDAILNRKLNSDKLIFESVKLAVAGFSSHQGVVMAELYGLTLEADAAVVYFGWNDHWLAYRQTDTEAADNRLGHFMNEVYHHSRLLQWMRSTLKPQSHAAVDTALNIVRVHSDQYRENLLKIHRVFDELNVPVIFITAPTAHYRLGVPEHLVEQKLGKNKDWITAIHKEYNQIVREVTQITGAHLLDLESEFDSSGQLKRIFMRDGIHFTEDGLKLVGLKLSEILARQFIDSSQHNQPVDKSDTLH